MEFQNCSRYYISRFSVTINMVLSNPLVAPANVPPMSFTLCDTTILLMTPHVASPKTGNVSKFTGNKALAQVLIMVTGLKVMM